MLMTANEHLLLTQHQNYSNQLKQATAATSGLHSNSMELLLATKASAAAAIGRNNQQYL